MPHPNCTMFVQFAEIADAVAFKGFAQEAQAQANGEPGTLYYSYSYTGAEAYIQEGYAEFEAMKAHMDAVGPIIAKFLTVSKLNRVVVTCTTKGDLPRVHALFEPMGLPPSVLTMVQVEHYKP